MKPSDIVILIGYRGTGKTTVARLLAAQLGWDWIDADAHLERKYRQTIHEIFNEEGETGFREKEAAVLKELLGEPGGVSPRRKVIAAGGGAILRPENRTRLRDSGSVVWLTADAETIWRRLQADSATPSQRPPLTNAGGREEIEKLLTAREPLYRECADLTVDTAGRTPEEVAESIIHQLNLE